MNKNKIALIKGRIADGRDASAFSGCKNGRKTEARPDSARRAKG